MDPSVGMNLLNVYELVQKLGSKTDTGDVWLGRNIRTCQEVVVKFLRPEVVDHAPYSSPIERFQQERTILLSNPHANICPILDIGEENGTLFYVMPMLRGKTLASLLKEHRPIGDSLTCLIQVAKALVLLHSRGIIHRDIKQENILVGEDGTTRLIDMGFARISAYPIPSSAGDMAGTLRPPEAVAGRPLTDKADIWQLGCVLRQCILEAGLTVPPHVAGPLDSLVTAMRENEPSQRPTAGECLRDLRELWLDTEYEAFALRPAEDFCSILKSLSANSNCRTCVSTFVPGIGISRYGETAVRVCDWLLEHSDSLIYMVLDYPSHVSFFNEKVLADYMPRSEHGRESAIAYCELQLAFFEAMLHKGVNVMGVRAIPYEIVAQLPKAFDFRPPRRYSFDLLELTSIGVNFEVPYFSDRTQSYGRTSWWVKDIATKQAMLQHLAVTMSGGVPWQHADLKRLAESLKASLQSCFTKFGEWSLDILPWREARTKWFQVAGGS